MTAGFTSVIKTVPVELEIKFGTHNERLRGTLVGLHEGEYLIVEIPRKYNWLEVQEWFTSSVTVVLRGVLEHGQVIAAATRYLSAIPRPHRMVVLSYPKRFEERSLRQVPRLQVELDAKLRLAPGVSAPEGLSGEFQPMPGLVTDLSKAGIGFESTAPMQVSHEVMTGQLVELVIHDEDRVLAKVLAEVKACKKAADGRIVFGLAVDSRNKDYQQTLDELVLHSKSIKKALRG